jgi:hypothetical protein
MRYFFHAEGRERIEDPTGLTLRDDFEARDEAVAMATVLNEHQIETGAWRLVVVNELGERITEIPIFKPVRMAQPARAREFASWPQGSAANSSPLWRSV